MKKFSDKVIVYMGSNFIGSFLQLVTGMLMVRYLTKYDYGTFRQIMLIAVLVSTTIAIGLPQSLSYFIPRASTRREKKQLAFQVFIALSLLGLIAAIICYLLRFWITAGFNNPDILHYSWIFSLFFLFLIPSKCTQATLVALDRTHFASFLNAGTAIFNFLFVIIPLILGKDLKIILMFMLTVYIIKFIIVVYVLSSLEGGMPKLFDLPSIKAQFFYSYPLGASLIVGVMRKYIDQFIIAFFYNPVNFAIYSRGAFELPFIALMPYTLNKLMIPRIVEYQKEDRKSSILHLWHESIRKVALVFFPLFIFTFIFAEQIITLLFTSDYLDSVSIFRIYLVLLPFRIVAYRTILQAVGKTKQIFIAVSISLILSVVLGIAFERIMGMTGPAIAIVIGELAGSGFMLWQTKIHLKVSLSDLIPIKRLFYPLLSSLIVGIMVFPLSFASLSTLSILVTSALLYFCVYIFIMRIFNFFTKSDWDLICRWTTLQVLRAK
ncbi:MAG: oligosaccharide flippase family protein [Candidatus Scalinduaceae bacterium]